MNVKRYIYTAALVLFAVFCSVVLTQLWIKIVGQTSIQDVIITFCALFFVFISGCMFASRDRRLLRVLGYVIFLIFMVLSSVIIFVSAYYNKQQRNMIPDDIYACMQSDGAESFLFMFDNMLSVKVVFFLLAALVVLCFLFLSNAKAMRKLSFKDRYFFPLAVVISAAGFFLITQTALFVKIKAGHDEYLRDLIEFNETFSSLSDDISINVEKKERGELYVIVIGESESRDFVYADQGPYPNSPWRSQIKQDQSWIFFTNAYSSHTHTVPVLTAALGEGREISGRTFPKGVTLPGISRKAGIKTFWISNQAALGSWDTPVAALAYQCDETVFISPVVKSFTSGVRKPDSFLLPAIEEVFSKIDSSQNNLVIIHLMGSHSPYEYRYPKDYPGLDMRNKGNLGNERETNNYRSLLLQQYLTNIQFTDSVLKDIFGAVKKYAPERAFMLYFADHGEDIYSKDGYHDIAHFTWTKARIPMMLWMSDKYRQENSSRLKQLQANAGRIFTNDLVFDLYLGLANIKVQGFTDKYDISGANYSLNADNAIITGGRKIKDDPFYIMASNIAADTSKKLTMHRANAVFKATRGQKLGLKNFEVDLVFEEGPSGARFMVGHGDEGMSGFSLEQWLDGLVEKPEFLWLDVKNLSSKNASQMLQHLEALDSRYGLKQFALLESYSIGDLTNFTKKGWKTSWYLPWERLIAAVESSDTFAINDLAAKAHKHQVSAVSYDLKADAAVREHLLRLLPEGTLLFAWHTPFSFFDSKLLDKIKDLQHLEKLLISFSSPYYI